MNTEQMREALQCCIAALERVHHATEADRLAAADKARAVLANITKEPADGWLQDGGLLYRLTDGKCPENRDEISVTMANGSRTPEARARRAGELLDRIRGGYVTHPQEPARVGGVPEGFDVQHQMATGGGLVLPVFVVRDTSTQLAEDVFQDGSPVVYALLKAWLTAAPQAPADARMVAAPVESYPTQDQAFYAFWYSHMKGELMQPPLAGISHSTARYIWDAAMSAKAGEKA
jgi:hypothetical protein